MIGKLLVLIGVIMIAIGGFRLFQTTQALSSLGLGNAMQLATDAKARESQLCKPGETLQEEQGASVYTPGSGYGRPTQSYCVDSAGNQRDVTGELVQGMIGNTDNVFSGIMGSITGSVINFGLIGFGLVLAIIGLIVGRRRSQWVPALSPISNTAVYTTTVLPKGVNGAIDLNALIQQARQVKTSTSSADLMTRLKQLDDARNAGLITQTEYERARAQILDTFQ